MILKALAEWRGSEGSSRKKTMCNTFYPECKTLSLLLNIVNSPKEQRAGIHAEMFDIRSASEGKTISHSAVVGVLYVHKPLILIMLSASCLAVQLHYARKRYCQEGFAPRRQAVRAKEPKAIASRDASAAGLFHRETISAQRRNWKTASRTLSWARQQCELNSGV